MPSKTKSKGLFSKKGDNKGYDLLLIKSINCYIVLIISIIYIVNNDNCHIVVQ